MPTSPYSHIETFAGFLLHARPTSILDIGLGNGKLGFFARDVLDTMLNQAYRRKDWRVRIDGIEIYADYIQDHQRAIYDDIHIGDALEVIDRLGSYDMVILGDVLEHLEKHRARELLDRCIAHTNRHLCVFIPLGKTWVQRDLYGNPYECHRSAWFFDELKVYACQQAVFDYSAGPYGAFLIHREDFVGVHVERFLSKGRNGSNGRVPLPERFQLSRETVDRVDLRPFYRHVGDPNHLKYFADTDFMEHYRLIAYLSTRFRDSVLFDIGSNKGYSALALSFNPSNRVVSYDIVDCKNLTHPEQLSRIEYRIGDVRSDPRLLSSPFIMLDTNHDGVFEHSLYKLLKENDYHGYLFLDDIHLNTAMIRFWDSISEPKADLTDLGHYSGSGLVALGENRSLPHA